jgi:hypothetical protein
MTQIQCCRRFCRRSRCTFTRHSIVLIRVFVTGRTMVYMSHEFSQYGQPALDRHPSPLGAIACYLDTSNNRQLYLRICAHVLRLLAIFLTSILASMKFLNTLYLDPAHNDTQAYKRLRGSCDRFSGDEANINVAYTLVFCLCPYLYARKHVLIVTSSHASGAVCREHAVFANKCFGTMTLMSSSHLLCIDATEMSS